MQIADLITSAEEAIRAGQGQRVARQLIKISPSRVPRSMRLPLANLCRRVGLISNGMKMLTPIVRAVGKRMHSAASDAELAEYAVLLERAGAVSEALRLLSQVRTSAAPHARLYEAFCRFSRWEYAESIPLLREYLAENLPPYSLLVGKVNLAAALLGNNHLDEAIDLLNENIRAAAAQEFSLLQGNCLEMRAQALFLKGQDGREDLRTAETLVRSDGTRDLQYVHKWNAILSVSENGDTAPLLRFREQAVERQDWESVRDSDRYLIKFNFERERFDHLLFGTPFPRYRERILEAAGLTLLPQSYFYGHQGSAFMDLATGTGPEELRPGGKIHQILSALLADFYRPASLGDLFGRLFPDEHFDVYSSPNRTRQAVCRARDWLQAAKIPAQIESHDSGYRLVCTGPFAFRVSLEPAHVEWNQVQLARLQNSFADEGGFTSRGGRECLKMTPSTFRRLMTWAQENHHVIRKGTTTATYYQLDVSRVKTLQPKTSLKHVPQFRDKIVNGGKS